MTTACVLVSSPGHLFPGHEEAPDRFQHLGEWATKPYAASIQILEPQPAPYSIVAEVHSERMLQEFKAACLKGPGITDFAPTFVTPSTFADAFLAAGGTLTCLQAVLSGQARNAFAIVRPPGHHAESEAAMGFCLLNNIAIATRQALAAGVRKALIVDFDAHHGNGTQAVFINEPRVAFFSTQQENIYPFHSGFIEDAPDARGRIVNLPLPPRSGDLAFASIADRVLTPLVESFKPELMLVSAGFDSHWDDPLAELGLSSAGYYSYAQRLIELAGRFCDGKILFVLEGGYNPANITSGVDALLSALTGVTFTPKDPSPYREPDIQQRLDMVCDWNGLRD